MGARCHQSFYSDTAGQQLEEITCAHARTWLWFQADSARTENPQISKAMVLLSKAYCDLAGLPEVD